MLNLSASCICRIDNNIFFSAARFNGLFYINGISSECFFIEKFAKENVDGVEIHKACLSYGNELIFTPWHSSNIHIYDYVNKKQSCITLNGFGREEWNALYETVLIDDKLYVFSGYIVPYICMDLQTKKIRYVHEFSKWCCTIGLNVENDVFTRVADDGKNIYLGVRGANRIIKWDLIEESGVEYRLKISNIFGIEKGRSGFCISTRNSYDLYSWSGVGDVLSLMYFDTNDGYSISRPYKKIIQLKDYVIAIPEGKLYIVAINDKLEVKRIEYSVGGEMIEDTTFGVNGYDVSENTLLLSSAKKGTILEVDVDNNEMKLHKYDAKETRDYIKYKGELLRTQNRGVKYIRESDGWSLSDYITSII